MDDENNWGVDEKVDEDTLFDMDEFVLQESSGYMLPTLRFLAVFHTVISLLCLVGYYCLKVGALHSALGTFFADDNIVQVSVILIFFL